ncbi:MAG: aldehyde dehydrogenase family protein [Leptolyngbya sp. PLA2]|nr:aldehyde dehydrogenase family protein [Leptolyngbya sp. PL-A2]MCQ3941371.1 N-succinylglutamate 5-semialdehyde dehydrogenase [cyanobacterium CYA1]MDL1904482.1 aldehyde dehydrogenase family protein [Synechococcales cyanobacterium CNB]GIK19012.1 MAG: N-succinylglutamate 5-semialdehyde dehydrogenase [Planctomycetota bacterium]
MSVRHPSLARECADLIAGEWIPLPRGGIRSVNPARPAAAVWEGSARLEHVDRAVEAARAAQSAWAAWPAERRFGALRTYRDLCKANEDRIAALIRDETGKVGWDAKGEASALAAKVDVTLDATEHGGLRRVAGFEVDLGGSKRGRCWFRPHGVMAVIAPFNFPMHLPNGHAVPALAMGNTVVIKPSDKTPACGQLLAELLDEALRGAGAPPGVVNLVQGGAEAASRLVTHDGIDGVLFTGSWPVGRRILESNLDRPGRIIALEMGGNNPAVVMDDCGLRQAVVECVRSAFVTTGQRCTCTRRVIVHRAVAGRFIAAVCKVTSNLIIGDPAAPHPVFMGPIISEQARRAALDAQARFARAGGEVMVESRAVEAQEGGFFISPGVVRVDRFTADDGGGAGCDEEVFGPMLRVAVTDSLDDAIEQANTTRFGLAASIFTRSERHAERFFNAVRAGCVNLNAGTAGASSRLPFGGLGISGNHRPAGSFSLDYCAYPVAGMIETGDAAAVHPGMRVEDSWLA